MTANPPQSPVADFFNWLYKRVDDIVKSIADSGTATKSRDKMLQELSEDMNSITVSSGPILIDGKPTVEWVAAIVPAAEWNATAGDVCEATSRSVSVQFHRLSRLTSLLSRDTFNYTRLSAHLIETTTEDGERIGGACDHLTEPSLRLVLIRVPDFLARLESGANASGTARLTVPLNKTRDPWVAIVPAFDPVALNVHIDLGEVARLYGKMCKQTGKKPIEMFSVIGAGGAASEQKRRAAKK